MSEKRKLLASTTVQLYCDCRSSPPFALPPCRCYQRKLKRKEKKERMNKKKKNSIEKRGK